MVMKLLVGLSKKVGQPNYGSLGASCHLEIELDGSLLHHDLSGLQEKARHAFVACTQAVQDELCRQTGREPAVAVTDTIIPENGAEFGEPVGAPLHDGHGAGSNGKNGSTQRIQRRATLPQVRAIEALADRQNVPLDVLLREQYQVVHPKDLSVVEASLLIDALKARGRHAKS